MRQVRAVPNVGHMGAYHGWGLGTGPRTSFRRQRATRRALALVFAATRDMHKPTAKPRATVSAGRGKRPST